MPPFDNLWKKQYKPGKNSKNPDCFYNQEIKYRKTAEDVLRITVTYYFVDIYRMTFGADDKYASALSEQYNRGGSLRVPIERVDDIVEIVNAELTAMGIQPDFYPPFEDQLKTCLEDMGRR